MREGDLIYCSARDITRQRADREALESSEREFRLFAASVVDYALIMLNADGLVIRWNAGAERIKGYAAEEIIGRHVSVFYTAADRAAGAPEQALRTAAEQGRYETESWRVRKDGRLFWANVVIDAIRDEEGELIGFAKITRDITERRAAQLELERANQRLAQTQKMEALGHLTGGVAHDFNNLLMVMGGQAELLRGRLGDEERAGRSLDAITTAVKRGKELTSHLLAFARRQRLKPASTSLVARMEDLTTAPALQPWRLDHFRYRLPGGLVAGGRRRQRLGDRHPEHGGQCARRYARRRAASHRRAQRDAAGGPGGRRAGR